MAAGDDDDGNVFITLTARELRADLAIVARAAIEDTETRLERAGADRVVSPYTSSGTEMARLALHRQLSEWWTWTFSTVSRRSKSVRAVRWWGRPSATSAAAR